MEKKLKTWLFGESNIKSSIKSFFCGIIIIGDNMSFILAQICGFTAWLMILLSYYRKNTNKILFIQILGIIFYLFNYLFLGAWSGLLVIFIELTRDYLYYKTDKDNLIFLLTLPIYAILIVFAWGDYIEIIPIVASLFEGFTLTKKKRIIVPGAIIVYSMWIVYDLNVASYSGVLTDILIVFSNIGILVNMIKGFQETKKFKISSRFSFGLSSLNKMLELYQVDEFCPMKSGNYRFD